VCIYSIYVVGIYIYSKYIYIYLFIYLFSYLSFYLSIYLFIYLFIYVYIYITISPKKMVIMYHHRWWLTSLCSRKQRLYIPSYRVGRLVIIIYPSCYQIIPRKKNIWRFPIHGGTPKSSILIGVSIINLPSGYLT
jgi:hypothetical protein